MREVRATRDVGATRRGEGEERGQRGHAASAGERGRGTHDFVREGRQPHRNGHAWKEEVGSYTYD